MIDRQENIHHISEHPSSKLPNARSPAGLELAIALLSSCLALVRPVGMGEAETAEWLNVAAKAVEHLPAAVLDRAALEARRTCTHHSQIVPTIIREAEELLEQQRRVDRHPVFTPNPSKRLPAPQLTQADVDGMDETMKRLGLSCGALVQDENGTVRPAPRDAA